MIKAYSTEGVVLARQNYGEADRIITIYSIHNGKVRLLAKGVRKPRSRKRGHIEIFSKIKFSAVNREGLDLVTEAELLDSYDEVRRDLKKTTVAYYFCEVVNRVTREAEKNENVFESLTAYLGKLRQSTKLRTLRSEFVSEVLVELGFLPPGQKSEDIDKTLAEVAEWEMSSARVGRQILT